MDRGLQNSCLGRRDMKNGGNECNVNAIQACMTNDTQKEQAHFGVALPTAGIGRVFFPSDF